MEWGALLLNPTVNALDADVSGMDLAAIVDWIREPRIAFAQVREDPALDAELIASTRAEKALLIASGGCTAAYIAPLVSCRLWLVDRNPAQLELSEEKLKQIGRPIPDRMEWHLATDRDGKYERLFSWLRELVGDATGLCAGEIERWPQFEHACRRIFDDDVLQSVFGEAATQGAERPFAEHFLARLRWVLASDLRQGNPWVSQMLCGRFLDGAYPWLEAPPQEARCRLEFRERNLAAAWPTDATALDFVGLSNITDWMSSDEARGCIREAWSRLAPGGVLFLRQLNSTHAWDNGEIPWDRQRAMALWARDRSFFYSRLHMARKP